MMRGMFILLVHAGKSRETRASVARTLMACARKLLEWAEVIIPPDKDAG
jgi:hypothetical protein